MGDIIERIADKFRAAPLAATGALAFSIVAIMAPHQVGMLVLGVGQVTVGAYAGYWIDRVIFPYSSRPHALPPEQKVYAWGRRALIVSASILAVALSV